MSLLLFGRCWLGDVSGGGGDDDVLVRGIRGIIAAAGGKVAGQRRAGVSLRPAHARAPPLSGSLPLAKDSVVSVVLVVGPEMCRGYGAARSSAELHVRVSLQMYAPCPAGRRTWPSSRTPK